MDTHLKFYKERKRFFHLLYVKKTNSSREFCAFMHALYTIYTFTLMLQTNSSSYLINIYCMLVFIMIIDDGDVIWLVVVINHLHIPYIIYDMHSAFRIIYNMHDIHVTDIWLVGSLLIICPFVIDSSSYLMCCL